MDELLKIIACTSKWAATLRQVYDKINVHVRGLISLGITPDQYGSLLIPVIMSNISSVWAGQIDMDEEAWGTKNKQLRAVHGSHRGVNTKLIRETNELLPTILLTTEGRSRLDVIHKQLSMKAKLLESINNDMLALCKVSQIDDEIGESETIITKIIQR